MPARAIASATISFGLVSIPVKLFTATSSEQVRFNMLHPETKSRVKQQYLDASTGEVVDRNELVKGFEYGKDQYVIFTDEELKSLEAERSSSLDIVEFVPLDSVDLLQVEKSYYLGPDKGGDKAYRLLVEAMLRTGKVAVGRWAARGKEQLVVVRPYRDGLLLHQMFYANEVRAFDEIDTGATFEFKPVEHELAERLIEQLSSDAFHPENYKDEYAARVEAAVQKKVLGEQVHVAQEAPKAQIIDLFEALKKSLSDAQGDKGEASEAKAPRAAKASRDEAESLGEEVKPRPVKKAGPRKARSRKAG
jgi:DNA end-binding protein Ku